MSILNSKRFVVRQSLIGKNQVINVQFKNGKTFKYNHNAEWFVKVLVTVLLRHLVIL